MPVLRLAERLERLAPLDWLRARLEPELRRAVAWRPRDALPVRELLDPEPLERDAEPLDRDPEPLERDPEPLDRLEPLEELRLLERFAVPLPLETDMVTSLVSATYRAE